MRSTSSTWLICFLGTSVVAQMGLTGLPTNGYDPVCAMACVRCLYTLSVSCSTNGGTLGMVALTTTPECWATNEPYLTSLAYCMKTKCAKYKILNSKFESFWELQATGQSNAGVKTVPAKWSYAEALEQLSSSPNVTLDVNATWLNQTSLVNPATYTAQYNVLHAVQRETAFENRSGVIILCTGFVVPILLTWLGSFPILGKLMRNVKPYLLWPSTLGTYSVRSLPFLLGNAPTVGQALYIAMFSILTLILCCVNYKAFQPSAWYASSYCEIFSYVMYRTGEIAYIILPLLFLFASRNNILQWLTNWSHSTYLVLHRWVARVFALLAVLHSILAVILYKKEGTYEMEAMTSYWKWGIAATMMTVLLTFFSGLPFRKFYYEIWLIAHIFFSAILIAGCWYHAYDLYAFLGGVFYFLCAASAVWFFDRLARVARLFMMGSRRAKVTELGGDYVRIDIPAIRWRLDAGQHVYIYFPTLQPLRFWENHPFSVLPTHLLFDLQTTRRQSDSQTSKDAPHDIEKGDRVKAKARAVKQHPGAGLTIYVRKVTGMTKNLQANSSLLTFVEGPYPNKSSTAILRCDRILLICGGIGITGLLPFAHNHWNVKLAWSLKESAKCVYDDLEPALARIVDKEIRVGSRLDVEQLIAEEVAAGWERVGVVACGPGGLCDEVRGLVIGAAKTHKTEFELEIESYSW